MFKNIKWLFFDVGSTIIDEHFGDRIDNDIIPAKSLGIHTIWIKQGFGQYWNLTQEVEKADCTVTSLMEICDIL